MGKSRIRLLGIATVVLAAVGALGACGDEADDNGGGSGNEPLIIGASLALTGDYAPFDIPMRQGIEYAVDQLNEEGGIDGHEIELNVKDLKTDPTLSAVVAQELLDEGAQVMISNAFPDIVPGVLNVTGPEDVATVLPNTTTPGPHLQAGPTVLLGFSDAAQATASAEFALDQGAQTMVTVSSPDDAYVQNTPKYFTEAFEARGGSVIGDVQFTVGQAEFGSVADRVADLNPDAVYTAMYIPDTPVFLKALRAAGFDGTVYGGDGFDDPALIEVGGDAAENVYYTTSAFAEPGSEVANFMDGIEQSQGERPEAASFAALGYDGVQAIKAAVEKAGSVEPSAITAAFNDLGELSDTLTGEITVNEPGEFPTKSVTILAVEDGELTQVDQFIPEDVPAL